MESIFTAKNYKEFLNQQLEQASQTTKGAKSALAAAMACQTSYLSQVLHGEAHLSLEQAEKLAAHFGLNANETEFLYLLIQHDRAGTLGLRQHFSRKMDQIHRDRLSLKNRVQPNEEISKEDQSTYYSSWIYATIHVLLTIPEFRTPQEIAKKLKLSYEITRNALEFLVSSGLVVKKKNEFHPSKKRMHIGHDSSMVIRHHTNWRLHALQSLESKPHTITDLHYSSVVSISKTDASRIHEKLLREIQNAKNVIKDSPEEELFAFHLDFYEL